MFVCDRNPFRVNRTYGSVYIIKWKSQISSTIIHWTMCVFSQQNQEWCIHGCSCLYFRVRVRLCKYRKQAVQKNIRLNTTAVSTKNKKRISGQTFIYQAYFGLSEHVRNYSLICSRLFHSVGGRYYIITFSSDEPGINGVVLSVLNNLHFIFLLAFFVFLALKILYLPILLCVCSESPWAEALADKNVWRYAVTQRLAVISLQVIGGHPTLYTSYLSSFLPTLFSARYIRVFSGFFFLWAAQTEHSVACCTSG